MESPVLKNKSPSSLVEMEDTLKQVFGDLYEAACAISRDDGRLSMTHSMQPDGRLSLIIEDLSGNIAVLSAVIGTPKRWLRSTTSSQPEASSPPLTFPCS